MGNRRRPPLELLVFVVGIATLGSEIAVARLIAPFFGDSTIVWANTIAVVLVALSIGYWFGGRLADRHPHLQGLCLLVLASSVLLGVVPIVAQPLLTVSVDAFDDVSVGAFAGSLFGVLALVSVPVLMLGAVSPWAIRLKLQRVEDSGETAGRMYAISTVGSLIGTFSASLLLIPLRDEPPAKVAMLGVAGGTVARAYAQYFPDTIIDAVEIDGELFDIGRRWFGLADRPQLRVHADDARPFLRRTSERYDFIFLDTYRQPYIPFYLATKEFFELARDRLAPGGAVIINVGHPENSPRLEQVLTATMGAALPNVARDPVRDTNTMLMGSLEAPS